MSAVFSCDIAEIRVCVIYLGTLLEFQNGPNLGLLIFHFKASYNNDSQTGHSIETFLFLWQVVGTWLELASAPS